MKSFYTPLSYHGQMYFSYSCYNCPTKTIYQRKKGLYWLRSEMECCVWQWEGKELRAAHLEWPEPAAAEPFQPQPGRKEREGNVGAHFSIFMLKLVWNPMCTLHFFCCCEFTFLISTYGETISPCACRLEHRTGSNSTSCLPKSTSMTLSSVKWR